MEVVIPDAWIYEEMDGVPIPYKNFHKALLTKTSPEEIMGSSVSQALVVSAILRFLFRYLDESQYWLATNEAGLHISKGNNLAADIAIFKRTAGKVDAKNYQYADFPPQVVIEVDIKADLSEFASPTDYYRNKARKLKQFGVAKVVWVNTQSETVMFGDNLTAYDWNDTIELIPDFTISIGQCVKNYVNV